jgi:hypothetical protein
MDQSGATVSTGDQACTEADGVAQPGRLGPEARRVSRRARRLSRVDRVRLRRVDRLFHNIEAAQFGWQVVARMKPSQRSETYAGVATPRDWLTQTRDEAAVPADPGDFIKDFLTRGRSSSPAGAVALDVACDMHGGRLMRLWMSRQADGCASFGGEGRKGAWVTETRGRGALVVRCTRQGCLRSARLTNDWLVARLLHVRGDFEAGRGLPVAWFQLSEVGE